MLIRREPECQPLYQTNPSSSFIAPFAQDVAIPASAWHQMVSALLLSTWVGGLMFCTTLGAAINFAKLPLLAHLSFLYTSSPILLAGVNAERHRPAECDDVPAGQRFSFLQPPGEVQYIAPFGCSCVPTLEGPPHTAHVILAQTNPFPLPCFPPAGELHLQHCGQAAAAAAAREPGQRPAAQPSGVWPRTWPGKMLFLLFCYGFGLEQGAANRTLALCPAAKISSRGTEGATGKLYATLLAASISNTTIVWQPPLGMLRVAQE